MAIATTQEANYIVRGKFQDQISGPSKTAFNQFRSNAVDAFNRYKIAIGAAVAAGSLLVSRTIQQGDQIQKLSLRLGASTEALSQYRLVAEKSGVSFNTLTTAWQRMTRRIGEAAQGTGVAKDALDELGLSATELVNLRPEEQFELIADAMNNLESQSDKVRIAFKLFDSEGVSLIQTMEGGAAAIQKVRKEAEAMGLTLSEGAAKRIAETSDKIGELKLAADGLAQVFSIFLLPAIEGVAGLLRDVTQSFLSLARVMGIDTANNAEKAGIEIERLKERISKLQEGSSRRIFLENRLKTLTEELNKSRQETEQVSEAQITLTQTSTVQAQTTQNLTTRIKEQVNAYDELAKKIDGVVSSQSRISPGNSKIADELIIFNRQLQEGKRITESLRTPLEIYKDELAQLNELQRVGAINQETYNRAIERAREAFDSASESASRAVGSFRKADPFSGFTDVGSSQSISGFNSGFKSTSSGGVAQSSSKVFGGGGRVSISDISRSISSLRSGGGKIIGGVPGFASGIERVPFDMLAFIHKDEKILNKQEAEADRQNRRGVNIGAVSIQISGENKNPRQLAREVRNELLRLNERVAT